MASISHEGLYQTEPFHLEKYVVPGAYAVFLLFLLPFYLFGGSSLGGVDFGTAIIAALILGHLIESLKVYQWGSQVRSNFVSFNGRVSGLLSAVEGATVNDDLVDSVKSGLFKEIQDSSRSEFAWNLVRWQKMTVVAVLNWLGAVEWVLMLILTIIDYNCSSPFAATFRIVLFKKTVSIWYSIVFCALISLVLWYSGKKIYQFGLVRQKRNNDLYFQLIKKHLKAIKDGLT